MTAPADDPNKDAVKSALDALRARAPSPAAAPDPAVAALAALRAQAPGTAKPEADPAAALRTALGSGQPAPPAAGGTDAASVLGALKSVAPAVPPEEIVPDPLASIRASAPKADGGTADEAAAVLGAMRLTLAAEAGPADDAARVLGAMRLQTPAAAPPGGEGASDALATLRASAPVAEPPPAETTASVLGAMRLSAITAEAPQDAETGDPERLQPEPAAGDGGDPLGELLSDLSSEPPPPEPAAGTDMLSDLLLGSGSDAVADLLASRTDGPPTSDAASGLLDDLLGGAPADDPLASLLSVQPETGPTSDAASGLLDDLLAPEAPADPDPLADLLDAREAPAAAADPLADLLGARTANAAAEDPLAALEALLSPPPADPALDDLLAFLEAPARPLPGLDDLLADIPATAPVLAAATVAFDPRASFGRLTAGAPAPEALARARFRIAVLGDFSGRAAGGMIDVGVSLARRPPHRLDIDTVENVIDRFATTLVLPIGEDGRGIEVPLRGLDSLHPDELVRSVAIFDELRGLRRRLGSPSTSAAAVAEMQSWRADHATHAYPSLSRSAAQAIPADRPLSEFQRLIGGTETRPAPPVAAPVEQLIARIVGPYVRPGPVPEAGAMIVEVDKAMSAAMRLVLHHPEFQAIEAAWRTLDLLARRINGDEIEITLYDISAQELAADLSTGADLSRTGLFGLLNAPLTELGETGFSAVFGLYGFEETPPHAELLGRMGRIAAHIRAPFFAALSPKYLETPKADRHPLVARAWDALAADPGAAWLSLLSPRFLLRRPYGKRTEPIDAFDFEEFTMAEGLQGMLWGNPAALMAVLLSQDWEQDGRKMRPGKRLTVNEIPFHYVTDPHGDQIALPCTERLVTLEKASDTIARGLIPVLAVKGRDEVRLGTVQSLSGQLVSGRWSDASAADDEAETGPTRTSSLPQGWEVEPAPAAARPADPAAAPAASGAAPAATMDDLDALLAGFGDTAAPINPDSIDADLAALLEGL